MVGGTPLQESDKKILGSIFSIETHFPGGVAYGVATHIGDGLLLTAYHVPCLYTSTLLIIRDIQGNVIQNKDLLSENFEISRPPVSSEINVRFPLALPDIAIIRLPEIMRAQIRSYPTMKLDFDRTFETNNTKTSFLLIGQGVVSFEPSLDPLYFQKGAIRLVGSDPELGYIAEWKPGDLFAVARPGDSGGPLLVQNESGSLIQIGVASLAGKKMNQEKTNVISAITYFTPLTSKNVRLWANDLFLQKSGMFQNRCEGDFN